MNFIKGLFFKKAPAEAPEEHPAFKYMITAAVDQMIDGVTKLISSSAFIVFDEIRGQEMDYLLILRTNILGSSYSEKYLSKGGDYYIQFSNITKIEEQKIGNFKFEVTFYLEDSDLKIEKVTLRFRLYTSLEIDHYKKFISYFGQLYFQMKEQTPAKSKEVYSYYINVLEPKAEFDVYSVTSKNLYPAFGTNYLEQFKKYQDQQSYDIAPIKRTSDEKADISDIMLKCQELESTRIIYSGQLFIIKDDEPQSIKSAIVFSLSVYGKSTVLELRDLSSYIVLEDDISSVFNFSVSQDQNWIKWLHVDDCFQVVYLVKFDFAQAAEQVSLKLAQLIQEGQKQKQSNPEKFEESKAIYPHE